MRLSSVANPKRVRKGGPWVPAMKPSRGKHQISAIKAAKTNLWAAIVLSSMACAGCGAPADNQCALIYKNQGAQLIAETKADKARMDDASARCTGNPACLQEVKRLHAQCVPSTATAPSTAKVLPTACVEELRAMEQCKAAVNDACDEFARARDAVKEDLGRMPLIDIAANSCEQTRIMQENQLQHVW